MPKTIPIENIYYLLCYAWNRLEEANLTAVTLTPETKLPDLFARVLQNGVTHLLKRGLHRDYLTTREEIPGVRGRIDVAASIKRVTLPLGRMQCVFDELSPDVRHNQIVKSTLRDLARVAGLDAQLVEALRDLYRRMPGVREIRITDQSFRRLTLGGNTSYYRFLLDVCEIVHRNLLIDERSGEVIFRDFTRDDAQMARLFERFLFEFYRREQSAFSVSAPQLKWQATGDPKCLGYLPEMRTDIVLRSSGRAIVVDAKYYASALSEYFGKASIHAHNLYQIFAYMTHLASQCDASQVSGILIYPRTTETVAVRVSLWDYPLLVSTINLEQPWQCIRDDLLHLLEDLTNPVLSSDNEAVATSVGIG